VARSTKGSLEVAITDVLGRGHLLQHARGGTVTPAKSRVFAIPISKDIRRGATGVRQSDRPRNLLTNNRRSVRITSRGIFIGQGGRLKMVYAFAPQVRIPKDVDFYGTFSDVMIIEIRTSFGDHLARAMATARR
jgi:hypothetical protein